MARVLHLHEHDPDYQTQTALDQLTREGATGNLSIGRGGEFPTSAMALLRFRRHVPSFDLVHAWGQRALSVAALCGAGRPIVYSPARFPTSQDLRWLRAILTARNINVICPTDTMRRRFVERGVPISRC